MTMDKTSFDDAEQQFGPPPANAQGRAGREAAVDRFLARRAKWKPTGMTLDEIVTAHREGRRV